MNILAQFPIRSRIIFLIILGLVMSAAALGVSLHSEIQNRRSTLAVQDLQNMESELLRAVALEQNFLRTRDQAAADAVKAQIDEGLLVLGNIDAHVVSARDIQALGALIEQYKDIFSQAAMAVLEVDELSRQLQDISTEINERTARELQAIQTYIGGRLSVSQPVSEQVRAMVDVGRSTVLLTWRLSGAVSERLFTYDDIPGYREQAAGIFTDLQVQTRNLGVLERLLRRQDHTEVADYAAYLAAAAEPLPDISESVALRWEEASRLRGELESTRKQTLKQELDVRTTARNEADLMAERLASVRLWSLVFLAAAFIIVSFLITRSITDPLSRIMAYVKTISAGDLEARPEGRYGAEFAGLCTAMRQMVNTLKEKMHETQVKSEEAARAAENACQATEDARQAQVRAENAKRDGMIQAAASLESVVERMTSASEELSAQVQEASRGAEEQKLRTDETATAMEEMNATVLEVARNASQAAESADLMRIKAQEGSDVVARAVEAINQVESQTQTMKGSLGRLGQQAGQIGRVMNVIEDIADQTNLLALNAAIEAARAGDAGRGFAVVADEVRKLAEKTMNATKEVAQAITSIQEGTQSNIKGMEQSAATVDAATTLVRQSGERLAEIVGMVDGTADQVRSIAAAAEEQSASSEEINRSVEDINRISGQTSEVMDQSAQAVSELARQAVELQELVRMLKSG